MTRQTAPESSAGSAGVDKEEREKLAESIRAGKVKVTLQAADPEPSGEPRTPIVLEMNEHNVEAMIRTVLNADIKFEGIEEDAPPLSLSAVIIPERQVAEGTLIKATSIAWAVVVERLSKDWSLAYSIPPDKWEEIVAGAYVNAGFDVILTPRSGDHGRDIVATTKGIGCVKFLGSVKAYARGNLVGYDDIRALLGVLSGDRDASKGIITTTSDFPPKVGDDPYIAPFLPTRLELVNGEALQKWLIELAKK